MEFLLSNPHC
jgi:20S proteasome subunit beta 2